MPHLCKVRRHEAPPGQRKELIIPAKACQDLSGHELSHNCSLGHAVSLRAVSADHKYPGAEQAQVSLTLFCWVGDSLIEGLSELQGSEEGSHAGHHPLQPAAPGVLHSTPALAEPHLRIEAVRHAASQKPQITQCCMSSLSCLPKRPFPCTK